MKAKFLLLIFTMAAIFSSSAIEPAAQLLVSMPDSLIPSIEVNRRKDLIDLFHAGQSAQTTTKLGGVATLTVLQDNALSIDLSSKSKMAIRIYTTRNNDSIITLINTVYAPAGDSQIRFFDTAWNELPASKYIKPLQMEQFFSFPDSVTESEKKELLQPVNIFLVEYKLETDGNLCARHSWKEYLDKETYDLIKPYLKDYISLHWDGKRFEK